MSNETLTAEELATLHDAEKQKRLDRIKSLPERTLTIANLRYKEGLTLQAIGDRYGITRERVRQILSRL